MAMTCTLIKKKNNKKRVEYEYEESWVDYVFVWLYYVIIDHTGWEYATLYKLDSSLIWKQLSNTFLHFP